VSKAELLTPGYASGLALDESGFMATTVVSSSVEHSKVFVDSGSQRCCLVFNPSMNIEFGIVIFFSEWFIIFEIFGGSCPK